MKLENAKGTRDIMSEEMLLREEITTTLIKVFKKYGFNPFDTPVIERIDVLGAKFAAGEESDALKETFKVTDQGERDLGLRFDLTVPLSRFVGMNPQLKMPFKRYQIGKAFRDGPIKKGRYREFTQCDVDIVGSNKMYSDAECVLIGINVFKELNLKAKIKVNNRKLLTALIRKVGFSENDEKSVLISIDKYDKIGVEGIKDELNEKGLNASLIDDLASYLDIRGNLNEKLNFFSNLLPENEGIKELKELFEIIGDREEVEFDPFLARGLGYYTGTVFEIYSTEGDLNVAIGAGGRYDTLIGNYLETKKEFPAVGISFGLDTISVVLKELGKINSKNTITKLYIVPIQTVKESFNIMQRLRDKEINCDMFLGKGVTKGLDYASSKNINYVLIIGENEINENKFTLKNMESGEEEKLTIEEIEEKMTNV